MRKTQAEMDFNNTHNQTPINKKRMRFISSSGMPIESDTIPRHFSGRYISTLYVMRSNV